MSASKSNKASTIESSKKILVTNQSTTVQSSSISDSHIPPADLQQIGQDNRPSAEQSNVLMRERIEVLEMELLQAQKKLQATTAKLEANNEELLVANQGLLFSNEELQATNEELHSVNQEMYTLNEEYQHKIYEMAEINAYLDDLFRSSNVATLFLDKCLTIRKFTPQATEIFQIKPSDVGRGLDAFAHQLICDDIYEDIKKVASGEAATVEREVADRNGVWYFLRIIDYQTGSEDKGLRVSLTDISSLKDARLELSIATDAINGAINGVLLTDMDWRIKTANPSFLSMFEFESLELIKNKRLGDLFASDSVNRLKAICDTVAKDVNPTKHEYTINRKDGTSFYTEVAGTVFNDELGNPRGHQVSFVDITRRREAEATRQLYAEQLERANATLRNAEIETREALSRRDQFLAILSHELRNPLGGIQHAVRVLARPDASDEQVERAKKAIFGQTRHMSRLMNDLLDVSRVTQGKIIFQNEVLDARELVEDAHGNIQLSLEKKNLTFEANIGDEPIYIDGDRARLLQVICNLLTNACRYTPRGGYVRLEMGKTNEQCQISVIDNGQGVPPEMVTSIFDMFVQNDSSLDRADSGMGVGLTLVKSLTEKMNGQVSVKSDGLGKGSTFTVSFPLTNKQIQQTTTDLEEISKTQPHADEQANENKKIVIVEDNTDAREMLEILLSLDGYDVKTAADGRAGLELIVDQQPELAFVDIGLPELSGFQVISGIQQQLGDQNKTRLVALTGYGQKDDHEKIMASGFHEHLVKPVDGEALNRVLEKLG